LRYLRHSAYPPGSDEPITIVIPEDSLKTNIHTAATIMREEAVRGGIDETVDIEIFDYDGDFVAATLEGRKRAKNRIESVIRHKITLRDWAISLLMTIIKPKGLVSTTRPSPLKKEDILEVLLEVTNHPAYKGQSFRIHDCNGEPVALRRDV